MKGISVALNGGVCGEQAFLEVISHLPHTVCRAVGEALSHGLSGDAETDDVRDVLGAAAPSSFLAAAEDEG